MSEFVRVLVVDDSAYVRKVVGQMLSRSPFIEVVGTARDGARSARAGRGAAARRRHLRSQHAGNGRRRLRRAQMARRPVPIVIISIAAEAGEQVLGALDAGAVDFVQKPTALATDKLLEIADELIEKVKAAARRADAAGPRSLTCAEPMPPIAARSAGRVDIVVIGISTGGPQGLKVVIPQLPGGFSGAGRDRAAHAGRLHRDVRPEARTSCRTLTSSRRKGRKSCGPAWCISRPPGRTSPFERRGQCAS